MMEKEALTHNIKDDLDARNRNWSKIDDLSTQVDANTNDIVNKVDKVEGKDLSTNDYTDADKQKLANIQAEANKTVISNNLNETTLGRALDATQGKVLKDEINLVSGEVTSLRDSFDSHKEEFDLHKEEFDLHKEDYANYKEATNEEIKNIKLDISSLPYDDLRTDVYGVEVDFENKVFTRLAGAVGKEAGADFDNINAFGGRRRCNLDDDGTVLAYYGDENYIEDGSNGQVMVEQPRFYYRVVPLKLDRVVDGKGFHLRKARYYVSDTMKAGFKLHPAFISNGKEKDFIYLSAFEGSLFDVSSENYILNDDQIADFNADMLSSIANAKPISGTTQLLTRSNTRKLANNRGVGWEQAYAATISLTQLLLTIEYASMNSQAVIGNGVVGRPSGEGNGADITGLTTHLGNASGSVETGSVSYRGEENVWGNIWKWVDGINVYIDPETRKTDAYVADHGFTDDVKAEPYKDVGFSLASYSSGSYISAFGYNEEFDYLFLPSEVLGNSALPVGDAFYNTQTGWRVARLGGSWNYSSVTGAFFWAVIYSSGDRDRNVGGRLVYVPQDEAA